MKIVVNLEKLDRDGRKMPANNPAESTPDNIAYAQLRYDSFLSPDIIQGVFVTGKPNTVEFTISNALLIWNFKLYTSTDGVTYTEDATFGGTGGKPLTSSTLDASNFNEGEIPQSNGTEWIPAILPDFAVYEIAQSGVAYDIKGCSFISSTVGWVCGVEGHIMKTSNGTSFAEQTSGTAQTLNSISFVDANTGWACGNAGVILKTTNGGSTWNAQTSGTSEALNDIVAVDSNNVFAISQNGTLCKTTDGSTWNAYSGHATGIKQMSFVSSTVGWMGALGNVYKTTNGLNFPIIASGLSITNILAIDFVDTNTGWLCGTSGVIMKTIDGGSTWVAQTSGTAQQLNSISFVDANTGWACGNAVILKTTNGGTTWSAQTSGTVVSFGDIVAIDSNNIFIVGPIGRILKTTNGGSSFSYLNGTVGRPVIIQTLYNGIGLTLSSPYYSEYVSQGNYSLSYSTSYAGLLWVMPMPIYNSALQDGSKIGDIISTTPNSSSGVSFSTVDLNGDIQDNLLSIGNILVVMGLP